jgi:quercetin dioxygenase-like cupin family protein/2-polyprenyl-3-methyl-5-hydroxy-6-metoxy-1,4-benzoquinol methylase
MKCQLCGSNNLFLVLDLGNQPICNALVSDASKIEKLYPLKLYVCKDCWLVQIENIAPKSEVFGANYNYLSGASKPLVEYFQTLAEKIYLDYMNEGDLIVDIGGNDGTFLKSFSTSRLQYSGARVLNVEPTPEPANIARANGIETLERFFTKAVAEEIGKAKVVTAFNVLAHCEDVHDFLEGVRTMMTEDSVFISQSHYLPALIEQLEYDTIYHEHLRYYTLNTLNRLFKMHGLYINYAEINDIYGGSIIVYASKELCSPRLLCEGKYEKIETYIDFAKQVETNRQKLIDYLFNLKSRDKKIVGIGAPMKASTMLNYCNIGPETLDYIAEVNPLKIGMFSPGTHIPIIDESFMLQTYEMQADYALILSWNFADEVAHKLREKGFKGGFIVPIPEFHTLNEVTAFADGRGKIVDVLTDEQIEHVNHITFKAGAVRGNHYHKLSVHYDYVLKGKLEVFRKLPYGPLKKTVANANGLLFTGMNERHALRALEDSEIMVFTRGPRGGRNYEVDTYRLNGDEKLV